jgi:hypothetical protein
VDPVPDPQLLRKSGSAGNRTRTSGLAARIALITVDTISILTNVLYMFRPEVFSPGRTLTRKCYKISFYIFIC